MALARIPAHDPNTPLDVADFTVGIAGTVIRPDDDAYDTARLVHNRGIDRHPSLIVRAASAADVSRTVVFARDAELALRDDPDPHPRWGHGARSGRRHGVRPS